MISPPKKSSWLKDWGQDTFTWTKERDLPPLLPNNCRWSIYKESKQGRYPREELFPYILFLINLILLASTDLPVSYTSGCPVNLCAMIESSWASGGQQSLCTLGEKPPWNTAWLLQHLQAESDHNYLKIQRDWCKNVESPSSTSYFKSGPGFKQ